VLVSFKRAVKLSTSFSNIIRFLLHSFSSWLRLNEISLTFSESVFTYLSSLLLISFMHISIFLFILTTTKYQGACQYSAPEYSLRNS
jgi:hypothetical protein